MSVVHPSTSHPTCVIVAKLDLKPKSGQEVAWEGLLAGGNCLGKSPSQGLLVFRKFKFL